jgi:aminopeptidase N
VNFIKKAWILISCIILFSSANTSAQLTADNNKFTQQDTLRGSLNAQRTWWNVLHYNISVIPDYNEKTIEGVTTIKFEVLRKDSLMQIDLQEPLIIDSADLYDPSLHTKGETYTYRNNNGYKRNGNTWLFSTPTLNIGTGVTLTIFYHGKPREAIKPPWDGGWIWKEDQNGNPWMSVACQGLGASVWYPCKDHQSDESDNGATLNIIVPDSLTAVGNGRLKEKINNNNGTTTWTWEIKNPINNYNIIPYIGKYTNFNEVYNGEKGKLDCSYWVLDYNVEKAKEQFKQALPMLKCFEYWFGPYPFYEDGYKLVEAPHLGMEHQSAVAYGNNFENGYLGKDLSGTGWGLKWDFIIIHESGHEWFANNITTNDIADMWVHEGFTNYSETLYTQYRYGKEAGNDYVIGTRKLIQNDTPIIGPYGVNTEGSGDMYYKGGNMLHTIRQVINNDEKFRQILRGLNKTFYHKTVTTQQIENYISQQSGINFSTIFDQYLRTIQIPVLEYKLNKNKSGNYRIQYRWTNCVKGFNLPLKIKMIREQWIKPTQQWQTLLIKGNLKEELTVDRNFYITVKKQDD